MKPTVASSTIENGNASFVQRVIIWWSKLVWIDQRGVTVSPPPGEERR